MMNADERVVAERVAKRRAEEQLITKKAIEMKAAEKETNERKKRVIYRQIIIDTFKYFNDVRGPWKIYINSEFDSSLTTYEEMSNNGEIGVLTQSDRAGYVMSLFLRMIIDNNINIVRSILEDYADISLIDNNIVTIVEVLQEYASRYINVYPANQRIDLIGTKISKDPSDLDLWTIDRIEPRLLELLDRNKD
jgi:hypothetical protein